MALQQDRDSETGGIRRSGTLLDDVILPTDGVWYELNGKFPVTVVVEGEGVFTASVRVSNRPTQPLPSQHGGPFGVPEIEQPEAIIVDGPFRWIKVRVTSVSIGGSVRADLLGGV